jgi:hypothetical protein
MSTAVALLETAVTYGTGSRVQGFKSSRVLQVRRFMVGIGVAKAIEHRVNQRTK